jgi:hypothetical protein
MRQQRPRSIDRGVHVLVDLGLVGEIAKAQRHLDGALVAKVDSRPRKDVRHFGDDVALAHVSPPASRVCGAARAFNASSIARLYSELPGR